MRRSDPQVELASGEYDRRKAKGYQLGIVVIERLFKLRPNSLRNYRANYYSRKVRPCRKFC
jgi:hypothetical protein